MRTRDLVRVRKEEHENSRKFASGRVATVLFATTLFITVRAHPDVQPSDPAAYYKAKCAACHGKTAEKKFDSSLPEEQLIDIVVKGKTVAKPPNMPAYGEKGV
jgi:mono/diheme cytochrome c family protein